MRPDTSTTGASPLRLSDSPPPLRLSDSPPAKLLAEALRVDRGRGDDDLEVGPAGQQPLQVAEDEVDVQAALVRLVDDQVS
jgi:hypothetical protein